MIWAHPRVCGENRTLTTLPRCSVGSSPRVRGKQRDAVPLRAQVGLIPACAGKTPARASATSGSPAHPRVCGENPPLRWRLLLGRGSSPRVRGKLHHDGPSIEAEGLIPACAGKTRRRWAARRRVPAHPRVCGENRTVVLYARGDLGSSPRVRGKLGQRREGTPLRGLIPACAGKTGHRGRSPSSGTAHPRVCGENGWHRHRIRPNPGSSPRVRGKPALAARMAAAMGLIPACAGKTAIWVAHRLGASAHPRVCGENGTPLSAEEAREGSSPRVRGKLALTGGAHDPPGLIPACAGKTQSAPKQSTASAAHPRVCGENLRRWRGARCGLGSSPRVRGKRAAFPPARRLQRLIPACAGKTVTVIVRSAARQAHPRVCGENLAGVAGRAASAGSSPRVRGKRPHPGHQPGRGGLIPACAGKTSSPPSPPSWPPAHPRVCGENELCMWRRDRLIGSSPRVRGKLLALPALGAAGGLIPACAGKTGSPPAPALSLTAHPRVCGENLIDNANPLMQLGSSPRVRGKPRGRLVVLLHVRLIPACAGKT